MFKLLQMLKGSSLALLIGTAIGIVDYKGKLADVAIDGGAMIDKSKWGDGHSAQDWARNNEFVNYLKAADTAGDVTHQRLDAEKLTKTLEDARMMHHVEYLQKLIKEGDDCQNSGAACTEAPGGLDTIKYANFARKELAGMKLDAVEKDEVKGDTSTGSKEQSADKNHVKEAKEIVANNQHAIFWENMFHDAIEGEKAFIQKQDFSWVMPKVETVMSTVEEHAINVGAGTALGLVAGKAFVSVPKARQFASNIVNSNASKLVGNGIKATANGVKASAAFAGPIAGKGLELAGKGAVKGLKYELGLGIAGYALSAIEGKTPQQSLDTALEWTPSLKGAAAAWKQGDMSVVAAEAGFAAVGLVAFGAGTAACSFLGFGAPICGYALSVAAEEVARSLAENFSHKGYNTLKAANATQAQPKEIVVQPLTPAAVPARNNPAIQTGGKQQPKKSALGYTLHAPVGAGG